VDGIREGHIAHTVINGYKSVQPLHELLYNNFNTTGWASGNMKNYIKDVFLDFDNMCFLEGTYGGSCVVTIIVIDNRYIYVSHIGDSRAALWMNRGKSMTMIYETVDHKAFSEFERIIKSGSKVINGRIDGNLNISRAFGDWRFKVKNGKLDSISSSVTSVPDIFSIDTHGEFNICALLGSDALYGYGLSNIDYISMIKSGVFKSRVADNICKYASSYTNDDITTIYTSNVCDIGNSVYSRKSYG
jgi:serine/threonine protein phosphatase PrpC